MKSQNKKTVYMIDDFRKLPVAEKIGNCGISLPDFPSLSKEEVRKICKIILKFYK